jgi:hypothetical protein
MPEGWYMTEGIEDRLRMHLDAALDAVEHLRDRALEAIQYPDERTYRIQADEVDEYSMAALAALERLVDALKGE